MSYYIVCMHYFDLDCNPEINAFLTLTIYILVFTVYNITL